MTGHVGLQKNAEVLGVSIRGSQKLEQQLRGKKILAQAGRIREPVFLAPARRRRVIESPHTVSAYFFQQVLYAVVAGIDSPKTVDSRPSGHRTTAPPPVHFIAYYKMASSII
jgi:hypothetical protein